MRITQGMVTRPPSRNVQSGVVLPPAADPEPERVARGERADNIRYQSDPDQILRVRHAHAPEAKLPPDLPSVRADEAARFTSPRVTDVAIPPFGPSVWEALPEGAPDQPAAAPSAAPVRKAAPPPGLTSGASADATVRYSVSADMAARRWRVERDGQLLNAYRSKAEAMEAATAAAFTERQTGRGADLDVCGPDAPDDFAAMPVPPQS